MNITIVFMGLVVLSIAATSETFNLNHWKNIIVGENIRDTNKNCWGTSCIKYSPIKRNDEFSHIDEMRPAFRDLIPSQNIWQWMCPCETQYDIANLGPGHYPRYLAVASCIPKSCHGKFNFCKLMQYKVHILQKRDVNNESEVNEEQYIEQPILPESLRVEWQLKPMKIAVACIAVSEGRKN